MLKKGLKNTAFEESPKRVKKGSKMVKNVKNGQKRPKTRKTAKNAVFAIFRPYGADQKTLALFFRSFFGGSRPAGPVFGTLKIEAYFSHHQSIFFLLMIIIVVIIVLSLMNNNTNMLIYKKWSKNGPRKRACFGHPGNGHFWPSLRCRVLIVTRIHQPKIWFQSLPLIELIIAHKSLLHHGSGVFSHDWLELMGHRIPVSPCMDLWSYASHTNLIVISHIN